MWIPLCVHVACTLLTVCAICRALSLKKFVILLYCKVIPITVKNLADMREHLFPKQQFDSMKLPPTPGRSHHSSNEIFTHFTSHTSWSSRLCLNMGWRKFIIWGSNDTSFTSAQIHCPLTNLPVQNWMFKLKMQVPLKWFKMLRDMSVSMTRKQWSKWWVI